jgi:hypothetical protein
MPHVHAHAPHELTEGHEEHAGAGPDRTERRLELIAVLVLSLATLATAWSGYQAARWSGEQSQGYARASAMRVKAQQQATTSGQERIADLLLFNGWLGAHDAGDTKLEDAYEHRFRAEFVPAFDAWIAQRPFTNPDAIPGPQGMPQYKLAAEAKAAELDAEGDRLYKEGTDAKANDDHYILSTVFFAAVLFFAGISLRLMWRPLRITVLAMASALLLGGLIFVLTLPIG